MKKFIKNTYWMFIIAFVIIILDQITKWLIRANLASADYWTPIESLPFFRLVHWKNTGVAFGMLQGMNLVFIILAGLVAIGLIVYYSSVPKKDWLIRLALALELGGAVGNLIDRIRLGHVIDFIWIGNFPVFNIADSSITVGVFILLLGIWVQERRIKREVGESSPAIPDEVIKQ